MANPRIDELKRRIEREPGSRLFAQLAEELRKEGDLVEAIRVARSGLAAHPNYPSARLTLGRALFDTGQFGPARVELEAVLRGAPDNILAARMLAECLEGLGDPGAALLQYRAALRLSPGDKQIEAQVRAIEQRLVAGGVARTAISSGSTSGPPVPPRPPAAGPGSPPGPSAVPPLPPRPGPVPVPRPSDDFDDVFEPAPSWKRPATPPAAVDDEAILLLEDEAPTLPGAPFTRPARGEWPSPPGGPAAPVTLAFEDAPLTTPAAPGLPGSAPAPADLAADSLAGSPVSALSAPVVPATEASAPAPGASEHGLSTHAPVPSDPALRPPGGSAAGARVDDGASTAAFAALPNLTPPASEPAAPEPDVWEWQRIPPSPTGPAGTPPEASFSGPGPDPVPAPTPLEPEPSGEAQVPASDAVETATAAPLSTPTLAELYFDQGFFARAAEVYEQILEREPHNERLRARLIEVKAVAGSLNVPPREDPRAAQRHTLQRKIARLEQMLAAVRRG